MIVRLKSLPVDDRIRLVEDLWDSIAAEQSALTLSPGQIADLDRRLDAYEADPQAVYPAEEVLLDARKRL